MGLRRSELSDALTALGETLAADHRTSEYRSIARDVRWSERLVADLWAYLDGEARTGREHDYT